MIFGREGQKKTGLIVGISIAGVAFAVWLGLTLALAFAKPNVLVPSTEAPKVDTVYQYKVDTVKTIIIQPEGK
jgi:hypothetical protein